MEFTRELKNMMVGFFLSMSSADKEILLGNFNQTPESQAITNPVYSRNDFLRSIQRGQLSEKQLKWFYNHLDGMDRFHKNGGAMGASMLTEGYFSKPNDDNEPGFTEVHTFQSKMIDGSLGQKQMPTLTVLRDESRYGTIRIEDYCTEVTIKQGEGNRLISEFYCLDYKLNGTDLDEKVYDKLNIDNFNLQNFISIQAFNVIRSTATRNAIDHSYKVTSFYKIKKIGKEFVVKFFVEELEG